MPRVLYLDREGKQIDRATWQKHQDDPSYVIVREYDNGQVRARLLWSGRIENPQNIYPGFYKAFKLEVMNYTADGQLVTDPVDDGQTFPTEAAGVIAYEEFLSRWTDSHTNDFGEFQEVGNALAPELPPDPNRPATEPDEPELGGVGAW